ncbi:VWA domain-containing protein [Bacillus sp. NTK071]|uniref:vWA domain-containing protein n=1 Tax=Bacillus sp. NTK071 TaxID=2802175 RepID=UPI001A8C273E|nr:vWA domain-containing protein [Bacillus sp. NTK071]MBN8210169.1 VWA domain-containing protein [Bacillus sp. NTK071]
MKKGLTEVVFLLDRSGSMAGLELDTIGGFNGFVRKQCEEEGETLLTTVLFDDQYEVLWDGVDATKVVLTDQDYYVRGMTALLDAVGKTVVTVGKRLSETPEHRKPEKVIVVITTDGMENASLEYTHEKVKELIEHQRESYNWEFIFLGANIDASKEAANIGIVEEDAYQFEASEEGIDNMYMQVCKAVSDKR